MHGVLSGEHVPLRPAQPIEGLRVIGVPTDHFFRPIDPEVEKAVRAALDVFAADGIAIREVPAPWASGPTKPG